MRFHGFGDGAVEFYDGLLADNSKPYWNDNKHIYERDVREPMQALLGELESEFGPGKIFRPYRDLRFTPDKTPYKTHCGAQAGPYYVEISSQGLLAAGGYHRMAPDQLVRYRAAVDDDRRGSDLAERIAELVSAGLEIGGERLRTRATRFRRWSSAHRTAPAQGSLRLASMAARRRASRAWLSGQGGIDLANRTPPR